MFEYGRDDGHAVVGGLVYRGTRHPALDGVYVFPDAYRSDVRLLRRSGDDVEHRRTGVEVPGGMASSFGEGADGELCVVSLAGGIYRLDP